MLYSTDLSFINSTTKIYYNGCSNGEPGIICTVSNHINANATTKITDINGFVNERGEPQGPIREVLDGRIDVAVHTHYLRGHWKEQTYPFYLDPINVASIKIPAKYLNPIMHFLTLKTCFYLQLVIRSLVCIITLKIP